MLKGLAGIMLAQRCRRWPSITSAFGQCTVLSGVPGAGIESVTRITMQKSANTVDHTMLFQCRASIEEHGSTLKQHWVNATCFRKVYSRPSDGSVMGQRRRRLTAIEPLGSDAGSTLSRNLGGRLTSSVRGTL